MLKSMTGFGKAECLLKTKKLTIEIKSLNSKQLDTSTRLPAIYKGKDLEIRQILGKRLDRGKIDCTFHYELLEGTPAKINTKVVKDYLEQLQNLGQEYSNSSSDLLSTVMRLPDTVISEKDELADEEWIIVKETINQAIEELDKFRVQEGNALEADLSSRIEIIRERLADIEPFEAVRIERLRERILGNLEELKSGEEIDKNRFEQELIFYMEKLDITEEKVRLTNHLNYFLEILKEGSPNGKKLGFIGQEIGREINTLGSKANHSEIQKTVVGMKDELEKIKEQILNVL